MKETIRRKFNEARKDKNELNRKTYESVIAKIIIAEKSGKYELPLSNEIIMSLIQKEIKELEETRAFYVDRVKIDQCDAQIQELKQYLPSPMTSGEVYQEIWNIIDNNILNEGQIIRDTIKRVGNCFDRSKIPAMVKKVLELKKNKNKCEFLVMDINAYSFIDHIAAYLAKNANVQTKGETADDTFTHCEGWGHCCHYTDDFGCKECQIAYGIYKSLKDFIQTRDVE